MDECFRYENECAVVLLHMAAKFSQPGIRTLQGRLNKENTVAPDTELARYPAIILPDIRYPAGYPAE